MEDEKDSPFSFHTCRFCSYRTKLYTLMCNHMKLHRTKCNIEVFRCDSHPLELFKCDQCEFETALKVSLHNHVSVFHEEKEATVDLRNIFKCYECEYCGLETYSLLVLLAHTGEDHSENLFKSEGLSDNSEQEGNLPFKDECEQCSYGTDSKASFEEHRHEQIPSNTATEHNMNIERFECEQCSYETVNNQLLETHMENKHSNWFECAPCSFKSRVKHGLNSHLMTKSHFWRMLELNTIEWFECEHCQYKTVCKLFLRKHIEALHSHPLKTEDKKDKSDLEKLPQDITIWFQCGQCSYKTLRIHFLTKHKKAAHSFLECKPCLFKTRHKSGLYRHCQSKYHLDKVLQLRKVAVKPKITEWLKCEHCGYRTEHPNSLKKHVETEHSGHGFECKPCSFKTRSRSRFQNHLRWENHLLKVKALDNFEWLECEHCPYKTVYKMFLEKHVEYMHTVGWFQCGSCPFKTKHKSGFSCHLKANEDHRQKKV